MQYTIHDCIETTPNIAVLKYWGKRDVARNLPANSSISLTLDSQFSTHTLCISYPSAKSIELYLNGSREDLSERHKKVISELSKRCDKFGEKLFKGVIYSRNSFPSACGLASSASGAAAFVLALSSTLKTPLNSEEIVDLVRLCSGSGVRSLMGNWVHWNRGEGVMSSISPIKSEIRPEIIVYLIESQQKKVPSAKGMGLSAETSPLYQQRINFVAPHHETKFMMALISNDWNSFCETVIADCESFVEVCESTVPPLNYQNELAKSVFNFIKLKNKDLDERFAVTFDAGSNPFIFTKSGKSQEIIDILEAEMPELKQYKRYVLRSGEGPCVRLISDSFKEEIDRFMTKYLQ